MSRPSDRFTSIQPELEDVRQSFLRLVDLIPDEALDRRFPGEGWTIKQELVHIVQALAILPKVRADLLYHSFQPASVAGLMVLSLFHLHPGKRRVLPLPKPMGKLSIRFWIPFGNCLKKPGRKVPPILANIEQSSRWPIDQLNILGSMPPISVIC
jgi:hypothetical protein